MSVASFFAGIENGLHSFGAWVEKVWTKIYASAPTIEHIADVTLTYAISAVSLILPAVDPAAVPVVQPILSEIQKDLAVASGLIYDFGPSLNVSNILSSVASNLTNLLAAGHVKDAAMVAKITQLVNTISSLAAAITKSLATPPAA
jgi:hypothetical protein